jgi:RHS repeat-associated protein
MVVEHRSAGIRLIAQSSPGSGGATMVWKRNDNATADDFDFDLQGNVTACTSATCASAVVRSYQASGQIAGHTVGISTITGDDGVVTVRRFLQPSGVVSLTCEIVPTSGPVDCTIVDNTGVVTITGGTMRRLERRYYDANFRLQVAAVYDPATTLTSGWTFPVKDLSTGVITGTNWLDAPSPLTTCNAFLTTQITGSHRFDVTVFDVNSDGDATLNETGNLFTGDFADALLVRANRVSASAANPGITKHHCRVYERNSRGDVTKVYERFDGVDRTASVPTYLSATVSAHATNRQSALDRYRAMPLSTPLRIFQSCSGTAYDDEGRLICYSVPQAAGTPTPTIQETTTPSTGVFAYKRVTTTSAGAASVATFEKFLGDGWMHESGIGDSATGGYAEGNFTRYLRLTTGTASAQGATTSIVSLSSTGTVVATQAFGYNTLGQLTTKNVVDPTPLARLVWSRSPDDENRTQSISTGGGAANLVATYGAFDGVDTILEPDAEAVDIAYGTSGNSVGRQEQIFRCASLPCGGTPQQEITYARDGRIESVFNVPLSPTIAEGSYAYDAFRRLRVESRPTVGQTIELTYHDNSRVSQRRVKGTDGVSYELISTSFDGLGRPLQDTTAGIMKRTWKYDDKSASFLGTYTEAGTGRTIELTNNFQAGQLAYEQDPFGATFYEYDVVGRIKAIVRHEGSLLSFSGANLTEIEFGYGSAGQLSTVTYPSGRVITYQYGPDLARPTGVLNNGVAVVSSVLYEPYGAIKSFRWGTSSTRTRSFTRDTVGRVTNIDDVYTTPFTSITYSYAGGADGDVTSETDASSHSWLVRATTAGAVRPYSYATNTDFLSSWRDDGQTESTTYLSDGRRQTETDNGTAFNYAYSATLPERMTAKRNTGLISTHEAGLVYDNAGRVTSVDWSDDNPGTPNLQFTYGQLGEVSQVSVSGVGTFVNKYDAQLRRTRREDPTGTVRRFFYAFGRAPLEEQQITGAGVSRWENIYLMGLPIAQVATTPTAPATLYNLHTDRLGVVRKIATAAGVRVSRFVSDGWGGANAASALVTDLAVNPAPQWNWRYPGQYEDVGGVMNAGWRTYLPELGISTSPEPQHQDTVTLYGPQNYTYASQNPLFYYDPDARTIFGTIVRITHKTLKVMRRNAHRDELIDTLQNTADDVICASRKEAEEIAQLAGDGGRPTHHDRHPSGGHKSKPHFHPSGLSGHVFYSVVLVPLAALGSLDEYAKFGVFSNYTDGFSFTEQIPSYMIDSLNPASLPSDANSLLELIDEVFGTDSD